MRDKIGMIILTCSIAIKCEVGKIFSNSFNLAVQDIAGVKLHDEKTISNEPVIQIKLVFHCLMKPSREA